MIEKLQRHSCEVVFTKRNGDLRIMRATLKPEIVRDRILGSGRKVSDEIVPVIDLDKDEWRSFRLDSIVDFNVMEE